MEYPQDWSVVQNKTLVVGFTPRTGRPAIAVVIDIKSVDRTVKSESEIMLKILEGKTPDLQLMEFGESTLAGLQAYRFVWKATVRMTTYLSVFTIKANKKYTVQFSSEVDKYSSYLPTAEKMIKSFGFTNPSIDSSKIFST